jgi:hypothetical protein
LVAHAAAQLLDAVAVSAVVAVVAGADVATPLAVVGSEVGAALDAAVSGCVWLAVVPDPDAASAVVCDEAGGAAFGAELGELWAGDGVTVVSAVDAAEVSAV